MTFCEKQVGAPPSSGRGEKWRGRGGGAGGFHWVFLLGFAPVPPILPPLVPQPRWGEGGRGLGLLRPNPKVDFAT